MLTDNLAVSCWYLDNRSDKWISTAILILKVTLETHFSEPLLASLPVTLNFISKNIRIDYSETQM